MSGLLAHRNIGPVFTGVSSARNANCLLVLSVTLTELPGGRPSLIDFKDVRGVLYSDLGVLITRTYRSLLFVEAAKAEIHKYK